MLKRFLRLPTPPHGQCEGWHGAPATTAAPPRKYSFRLDVESAQNPDEDFVEGPVVTVEVAAKTVAPAKKFPVWIIFAILGAVVLIGSVVLFFALRHRGNGNENQAEGSPTPETSPTAEISPVPPSPSPVAPAFQVTGAMLSVSPTDQPLPCITTFNFAGTISVNAPGTVTYKFVRSNGQICPDQTLTFNDASTQNVNAQWTFRLHQTQPNPIQGWLKILITSPNRIESPPAFFRCG